MDRVTSEQIINRSNLDDLNLGHVVFGSPLPRKIAFFILPKIVIAGTPQYYVESSGFLLIMHGTSYSCEGQQK
jgi:hypothetical protein